VSAARPKPSGPARLDSPAGSASSRASVVPRQAGYRELSGSAAVFGPLYALDLTTRTCPAPAADSDSDFKFKFSCLVTRTGVTGCVRAPPGRPPCRVLLRLQGCASVSAACPLARPPGPARRDSDSGGSASESSHRRVSERRSHPGHHLGVIPSLISVSSHHLGVIPSLISVSSHHLGVIPSLISVSSPHLGVRRGIPSSRFHLIIAADDRYSGSVTLSAGPRRADRDS
jgi:hypothetical protein